MSKSRYEEEEVSHCGSRDSKNIFMFFFSLIECTHIVVDSRGSCFEINIDLKCN